MNPDALVVLDAGAGRRPHLERRVEPIGHLREALVAQHVPSFDLGCVLAGEVQRDPLTPCRARHDIAVHLQAAHAEQLVARQATDAIAACRPPPAARCPVTTTPVALEHEHAIHRQPEVARRSRLLYAVQSALDLDCEAGRGPRPSPTKSRRSARPRATCRRPGSGSPPRPPRLAPVRPDRPS